MTIIKASCPLCGDIELHPRDVRLVVYTDPTRSHYTFTCPGCHDQVEKPADPDVIALLRTGGVHPEHWTIPAEALELHVGPRIAHDDLLDAHLQLQHPDVDVLALALTDAHPRSPSPMSNPRSPA